MRNIIKKLVVGGLCLALSVTTVFARTCIDKQIPDWADGGIRELVDENINGGTRTITDVIVRDGVAFVSAQELGKAYGFGDYEHGQSELLTKIGTDSIQSAEHRIANTVYIDRDKNGKIKGTYTVYTGSKQQCMGLKPNEVPDSWLTDPSVGVNEETREAIRRSNEIFLNNPGFDGKFETKDMPFYKNDKLYVPAKLMCILLNNNINTKVTYDAKNNTITFQDEVCAPIYTCIGYYLHENGKIKEWYFDGRYEEADTFKWNE